MNPATETKPICGKCGASMVNVGAPPSGNRQGESVYICPKCQCPASSKTKAKAFQPKAHVPGCPKCKARFVKKATPGEKIYCSICNSYFAYNVRGKLVECDELGTIYKKPRPRRKRKKQAV